MQKNKYLTNLKNIPRSIWALGFVSLFMDTSSELIHSLLPLFMVTILGASMTSVGLVEGISEATALIVKIFSGVLSDYFGKRKLLTVIGYGLAALTKPLFPLANSVSLVLAARFLDRIGKGVRGAPRDALIGDIAPPDIRGACFGLRQALDTVGAFLGPLLGIIGLLIWADNLRMVLWIALVPAAIAPLILIFGVKEPERPHITKVKSLIAFSDIRFVGQAYWQLVTIAGVLSVARFSEAFLILKAQEVGIPIALIPMVIVVMNVVYAFAAYPAGFFSDRTNRNTVLLMGIVFLIVADVVLGLTTNPWMLTLGVILWGLHLAFTQGLLAAMITDTTPVERRGVAYGVFNLVCGSGVLIASVIAGFLWDVFGSAVMFFVGAILTAIAFIGTLCNSKFQK